MRENEITRTVDEVSVFRTPIPDLYVPPPPKKKLKQRPLAFCGFGRAMPTGSLSESEGTYESNTNNSFLKCLSGIRELSTKRTPPLHI